MIVSFAIAGYAFLEIADHPGVVSFAIFFAGAIVAHDLIAFPIYSALNRIAGGGDGGGRPRPAVDQLRARAGAALGASRSSSGFR